MTKNIYIVRHCQAEGQDANAHLTKTGLKQAENLAMFLSSFEIDQIISSPFLRAIQSIEPFAKKSRLKVNIDDRLSERVLSSKSLPDWMNKLKATYNDFALKYAGGESTEEAQKRIVNVVNETISSDYNHSIIVTHGNIMSLLLNNYDEKFGFEQWKNLSNPDVFLLQVSPDNTNNKRLW